MRTSGISRLAAVGTGPHLNTRLRGIIAFMAAISVCHALTAATFYVAPGGSDSSPGSKRSPFATIQAARDAARAKGGTGHIILIGPGRYFNPATLTFDDRDSGLTIKGTQPGATAELYGGLPVTGWEKWTNNIWRAPVPKGERFYNLIVDGKPATMAQTPNAGSGFGGGAGPAGNGAVHVPAEWRGYDYSDAQVFTFIGANWFGEMRVALKSAPDANGNLPVDEGNGGPFGGMNGRMYLRGVLEFLDEPGEWCLKHKEGFVYYRAKTGTPADHLIVRPAGQRFLEVMGRAPAATARNITFENVSIIGSDFCDRWYLFLPGKDGSTPDPLQQGMIFGENVERLTIKNCRLLAAGHAAVWLNKYAQNCVVENNLIIESGFAGVYLNGWTIGEEPFKSAAESYVNKGHRIESNFIHDCSKYVGGGGGIQIYQSGDNLILRNEISQMPRYGISFKGLRFGCLPKTMCGQALTFDNHWDFLHTRSNRTIGNDIYSVCRNSLDYGGIESWGPGRDNLWENNAVHDLDQALEWNAWAHIVFADDGSHYLTTRSNILYHCHGGDATGAFMMKNIGEEIANNLLADCTLGRIVTLAPFIEPGWDFAVRRNVFAVDGNVMRYDTSPQTFSGMAGTLGSMPANVTRGIREVDCNVIAVKDPAKPNPSPYPEHGMDRNSYFGDPRLKRDKPAWDIQYADYSLAADSPAFKLGFRKIATGSIGLRKDFPFDKAQATRRPATEKIQAEDYQRMSGLRTDGGLGIRNISKGAWAKYANIDFGAGQATQALFSLSAAAHTSTLVELRLDSPAGQLIGRLESGQSTCPVMPVQGVHNVFLVFPGDKVRSVDSFRMMAH